MPGKAAALYAREIKRSLPTPSNAVGSVHRFVFLSRLNLILTLDRHSALARENSDSIHGFPYPML